MTTTKVEKKTTTTNPKTQQQNKTKQNQRKNKTNQRHNDNWETTEKHNSQNLGYSEERISLAILT